MKITIDKHYSLKEINNSLQRHFKNYKFYYTPNDITVVIPDAGALMIFVKGKEIVLRRETDFIDLIPFWSSIAGRNGLSNNVHAKGILDFF
jgi:hypothetical protein